MAIRSCGPALSIALALGCAGRTPSPGSAPSTPFAAAESVAAGITAESALRHVAFLASDELAGRDTPSPGLESASEYIARRFEAAGLEPAGDDGGWLQRWPYERKRFDHGAAALRLRGAHGGTSLVLGEQWFALPSDVEAVHGRPVHVGTAEARLSGFPPEAAGRILLLTTGPALGVETLGLIREASEAGATGLLLVLHPDIPPEAIPAIMAQVEGLPAQPIPVAGVLSAGAADLLSSAGTVLGELVAAGDSRPLEIDGELELRVPLIREPSSPPNVVAALRGSDPVLRDEYVLYTAHFDHVGVGVPDAAGDSIYNGADDDASGTALLLEVARAFAALPEAPPRSLLFLAVSGEEKGLLGSRWWAENPTVPLRGVVANLNFDMVGRNHPDTVIVIGQEYSSLGPLARGIGAGRSDVRLVAAPDPDPAEKAFFRSDHVSFVRRGVPALFLTTWLHDEYHTPGDETERVDAEKLARVARLAFWIGWEVAREPAAPTWNEGAWEDLRRILEAAPF
ncbi:MAG: M20/M25/M40 family metallo-hydrolase [Gemmatimonadota bacterium]